MNTQNRRQPAVMAAAERPRRRRAASRTARRRAARSIRRRCDEMQALLTDRPRRRDLLIEHLHLIQDKYGHLSARASRRVGARNEDGAGRGLRGRDLLRAFRRGEGRPDAAAAGHRARLRFAVLRDGAARRNCSQDFRASSAPDVRVVRAPCMGACDRAPVVGRPCAGVQAPTPHKVAAAAQGEPHAHAWHPGDRFRRLSAAGGYALLKRLPRRQAHARRHHQDRQRRRPARPWRRRFPTGRKWSLVRAEPAPRLLAVNGDEGEPGTFKDRYYLERDPHRFIEGMLIAAWVVEAPDIYLYMRDEYPEVRLMLLDEIAKVEAAGLSPHTKMHLRRGAGAYICGEESAMIELIEGKRGLPRHRPPYVAQVGLFGRPTLEQNVETLFWVRDIVEKGADWFTVAWPPRAQGLPQLLGVGPGEESGREAGAGRRYRARTDRGILRRHGGRPRLQGLSARRRLRRHPAGVHGRPAARFRHARAARLLRRLACGRDPVRPGRHEGGRAQPDALLRGRELRPVHAVPRRHREGRQADGSRAVERGRC